MQDCIFCKIIEGKIPSAKVWEDEKYFAFLDSNPLNPGHTLLMPKKHDDYVFDLPDDEYTELMLKAKTLAKKLKEKIGSKKIGLIVEGFGVPHVHIHLVPINHGHELDSSRAKPATKEELDEVLKIINS